ENRGVAVPADPGAESRRPGTGPRGTARGWTGAAVGLVGLVVTTLVLVSLREHLSLAGTTLLYLVPVLAAAVAGGVWPALVAAVAADALVNYYFVEPLHSFTVSRSDNVVVLVVYVLVAATVAVAVDAAARQRAAAARRGLEAGLLAQVSAAPVAGDSLTQLLERVRRAYGMDAVALLEGGEPVAEVGERSGAAPALRVAAGPASALVGWGPGVFAEDRGTLTRLAAAAARLRETQRLAGEAAHARELAEIDRLRAALLNAVGHDLRTPLAAIKIAVSSLRQPDVDWAPADRDELLSTVDDATERLVSLVENLLSVSRLQAGVLSVEARPVALDAVVAQALLHTPESVRVEVAVPDDLPLALADPGLLERVLANLLANSLAATAGGTAGGTADGRAGVAVVGERDGGWLRVRVVDHGPGLPERDRERLFAPFQRLDDRRTTGLGLGLAIARGFSEAMGGALDATDTPGGGLTMTVSLPLAPEGGPR
ncbi:MAG TPA: ATP-binding protein, partial [Rugosimonospora sp.]|nr:ATP-binding protein [Rugosimonospora sp.]